MPFPTEFKFIEAAEARLGTRFPDAFRAHLLKSNGGEVEVLGLNWELAPVQDSTDHERLRRTAIDVVHETIEARKWPGFPKNAVAIGEDGCGNYLVFLPQKEDSQVLASELHIWWHEGSELESLGGSFSEATAKG